MNVLAEIFMKIGSMVCHQLPSRTLYVNNMPLPVCARDTGIYIGVFSALGYIFLRRRFNADKPPSLKMAVLLCLLMLPTILDAISSYLGLRSTNNIIRLFTGVLFGVPIPLFLVPAGNFKIYKNNTNGIVKSCKELGIVLLAAIALCLMVLKTDLIPWIVISGILVLSPVFLIVRIVYTIFIHAGFAGKRYFNIIVLGASTAAILLIFILSNFVLHPLIEV